MTSAGMIASAQAEALTHEITQQFKEECRAVIVAAETEAAGVVAEARHTACGRTHEAVLALRKDRARELTNAEARRQTEWRAIAARRTTQALAEALPLLRDALAARWTASASRRTWTEAAARFAATRLRHTSWLIEHPRGWHEDEQKRFLEAAGAAVIEATFKIDPALSAGVRISADQAVVDATPQGLLADGEAIAGLLRAEIEEGVSS